jgi:urea transport system ATP-binding protein
MIWAFVRSIADQVTVLHQGECWRKGRLEELQIDPMVIEVYLGAGDAYH